MTSTNAYTPAIHCIRCKAAILDNRYSYVVISPKETGYRRQYLICHRCRMELWHWLRTFEGDMTTR